MSELSVGEVSSDRLGEVIEVLADAFSDYEAMRYMLDGLDQDYSTRLRTLVGYFVGSRVAAGSPILGVSAGQPNRLVAAALVDPPHRPPKSAVGNLTKSLGQRVTQRLSNFEAAVAPLAPDHGFYYVGMIGVAKEQRGKGCARLLINQIMETSDNDPESNGVLLTTEHEANLALYQSMGFFTLGEATTQDGGLRSWTMYHADRTG